MNQSELLDEFDRTIGTYTTFVEKLQTLVPELLTGRRLNVHSVTARAKCRKSFINKIARPDGSYEAISDIMDLAGVRIITYFEDDVDRVAEVIRNEFTIDTVNSVDKRDILDPDRFGYLSLHYIITLPTARVSLAEYKRHAGLKAEIQIRSILQHAWAEIEHDLGYKTALGVPREVRRQFSRLAGLLEIADKEFVSIREALTSYEIALPSRIARTPETVFLDKPSFNAFIMTNEYLRALDQKIADYAGGSISRLDADNFENEVAALHTLGIKSVAALEAALRKRETMILKFAGDWLRGSTGGVGQAVSLLYLSYVFLGEAGDLGRTIEFMEAYRIDSARSRTKSAKKILETYKKLRNA